MPTAGRAACSTRASSDEGVERLPGAHCYEFYAGAAAFAAIDRRGPGDLLPDRLPGPQLRPAGDPRARPRPPPGAAADVLRQLPPAVYLAQTDDPALVAAARRAARRLGLAFELPRTGYGDLATSAIAAAAGRTGSRPRAPRSHGHAVGHLVARHPGPGRGQGRPPVEQGRPPPALPGRHRQGRQPGRQARLQRLHRRVAQDPASRAATISRPRSGPNPTASRPSTPSTTSPS